MRLPIVRVQLDRLLQMLLCRSDEALLQGKVPQLIVRVRQRRIERQCGTQQLFGSRFGVRIAGFRLPKQRHGILLSETRFLGKPPDSCLKFALRPCSCQRQIEPGPARKHRQAAKDQVARLECMSERIRELPHFRLYQSLQFKSRRRVGKIPVAFLASCRAEGSEC